jgi:hypothetical protein
VLRLRHAVCEGRKAAVDLHIFVFGSWQTEINRVYKCDSLALREFLIDLRLIMNILEANNNFGYLLFCAQRLRLRSGWNAL